MLTTSEDIWKCLEDNCSQNLECIEMKVVNDNNLNNSVRKNWSAEEDNFISNAVNETWPPQWRQISENMYVALGIYRTDDSIRNR